MCISPIVNFKVFLLLFVDQLIKHGKFQSWMIGLPHSSAPPSAVLVLPSARLGSDKYQFLSQGRFKEREVWRGGRVSVWGVAYPGG